MEYNIDDRSEPEIAESEKKIADYAAGQNIR
jgi:hypothetical protein